MAEVRGLADIPLYPLNVVAHLSIAVVEGADNARALLKAPVPLSTRRSVAHRRKCCRQAGSDLELTSAARRCTQVAGGQGLIPASGRHIALADRISRTGLLPSKHTLVSQRGDTTHPAAETAPPGASTAVPCAT